MKQERHRPTNTPPESPHYLKEHPGQTSYLLHEDWRLPEASGTTTHETAIPTKRIGPPGPGPGTTYLAFLAFYDSGSLTDLDTEGPRRIEGVRVPALGDYLRGAEPDDEWPRKLVLLRSGLPQSGSGDEFAVASVKPAASRTAWSIARPTARTPRSRWSKPATTSSSCACTSGSGSAGTSITSGSSSTTSGPGPTVTWPRASSDMPNAGMSSPRIDTSNSVGVQ